MKAREEVKDLLKPDAESDFKSGNVQDESSLNSSVVEKKIFIEAPQQASS